MQRAAIFLSLTLLAGCISQAPAAAPPPALLPTAAGVHEIELTVTGEQATGVYGVPDAPSTALVVFAHGLGGDHEYVKDVVTDVRALGAYAIV